MTTNNPLLDADDETVLDQLRRACAERVADPQADHDDERLYALRDHALSRGLPLPSSCPMASPGPVRPEPTGLIGRGQQ